MNFSNEQKIAFNKYIQRENIFITGPGGTGKSTLIKEIQLDATKRGFNIQVCALTGCAAVLLQCKAKTIHSWSGIGLGNGPIYSTMKKVSGNRYKKKIWKEIDILIIDEVSMMSQKLFELLDSIGKEIRKNNKPFGGIQVIFLGDFYQLPPVGDKDDPDTTRYCFESILWNRTFEMENIVQLKKIFRQTDETYTKILNQLREGRIKQSSNKILLGLVGKKINADTVILPTKLFPTRNKVDAINNYEMDKLGTEEVEYKLKYMRSIPFTENNFPSVSVTPEKIENELSSIHSNLICNDTVKLKIGAQVMCIVNIEVPDGEMICNGSQGIIIKFSSSKLPVVKFTNGIEMEMKYHTWQSEIIPGIGVTQIPLILAWALTIHKSQGATMDTAEIDVGSGIFECGQTYVALSRVKSLEGLYLSSFDPNKILINKKVRKFYDELNSYEVNKDFQKFASKTEEINFDYFKYIDK